MFETGEFRETRELDEQERLRELEERHTQELLEKSERLEEQALKTLAELDGSSVEYERLKMKERTGQLEGPSAGSDTPGFGRMLPEDGILRPDRVYRAGAEVSFGRSVEEEAKETELKRAAENGQKLAAEHRAKELKEIRDQEAEKKQAYRDKLYGDEKK